MRGPYTRRVPAPDRPRIEDATFTGEDALPSLEDAVVSGCTFHGCDLSGVSLRGAHLSACVFEQCELAVIDPTDALMHRTTFRDCRLTGVRFGDLLRDAVGTSITFEDCDLSLASFRELDLRECAFRACLAREAEFVACDLRGVDLTDCDLERASFRGTDLREADLRRARNYVVSPRDNQVAGMRVTLPEALNLLSALRVRVEG